MAVTPSQQIMEAISLIMAETLEKLHKFIETQYNHNNSEEIMVLMMSFTSGIILQLRDKMDTIEKDLGNKFLDTISTITSRESNGLETIEKLMRNDPSLNESSSGIDLLDLPTAVSFLGSNLINDMKKHFDSLPYKLRNDVTLTSALAMLVANILSNIDSKNVHSLINAFSKNIHVFVEEAAKVDKLDYN